MAALVVVCMAPAAAEAAAAPVWQPLADGVEYATFRLAKAPRYGDGLLHVVRVSPDKAELRILAKSELGGGSRTATQWCKQHGLIAAINAGMYETDHSTHTGYLRVGKHLNSAQWRAKYKSLLLIGPNKPGPALAAIRDLGGPKDRQVHTRYSTASQNLRLIRAPAIGVWKENGREWSEAAVAQDRQGRILLLFSRTPFSMATLNAKLVALPLGIVRAMHVEGGPEASLSVRSPEVNLDLAGSFETGFNEKDDNDHQWPIPNVLGVLAR